MKDKIMRSKYPQKIHISKYTLYLFLTIVLLCDKSFAYFGDQFSVVFNLRYSNTQKLSLGSTFLLNRPNYRWLQLQVQPSIGLTGRKIGFGLGFAGNPDYTNNPENLFYHVAEVGLGLRYTYLQTFEKQKIKNEYRGVEFSIAVLLGIDIGYYFEIEGDDKLLSFSYGFCF